MAQPKQSENDPGNSQGSGNFYEGPPQPVKEEEKKPSEPIQAATEETQNEELDTPSKPILKVIEGGGKPKIQSLNLVYEEFFKRKKDSVSVGLTTQYDGDNGGSSKGMLLNRKAE